MKKMATADIVIFGGGIAGLWLLNRLRQLGYSVLLFESGALGGGQTHKSQGIIHGGIKYALQGVLTPDAKVMADMPNHWRKCLEGKGDIDLSQVPILSNTQYLWSPSKLTATVAGFFAQSTLTSKVTQIDKKDYPSVFKNDAFKGEVFALDEIVVNVPVLVRELMKSNQDVIFNSEPLCNNELKFDDEGNLQSATVYQSGKAVEVKAQQFIFTAGAGNEVIIKCLKNKEVAMQRRPLHMVLVKLPFDYPLYGHCIGLSARPRITITTHYMQDGSTVWYLGGLLSEEGVTRSSAKQIVAAKKELQQLFPWLDFSQAEFSTFMVDRAEPKQKGLIKPETSFTKSIRNMLIAWPTKLALAPKLSEEIIAYLQKLKLTPHYADSKELHSWPIPPLAKPIWESAFCKSEN